MEILLCLVVFPPVPHTVQLVDLFPFHSCCNSHTFSVGLDISTQFCYCVDSPSSILLHASVSPGGTRGSPTRKDDYLEAFPKVEMHSWHKCCGNLASLFTQSKSCTWCFISFSSLSRLSVCDYTHKSK